jgi:hypothetical protein
MRHLGLLAPLGLLALLTLSQLGCSSRGVSVGTEELCTLEPTLAAASKASEMSVSTCATLGKNQLANAGFEAPPVAPCASSGYCFFPASDVPGWSTTSDMAIIEIWGDGQDLAADEGQQFAELDAESQDTLWQDLSLTPGRLMYWAFSQHGRDGIDSLELRIGPPEKPHSQGIFSSPNHKWSRYRGLYRVGASETTTRFALVSRSGTTRGNLVDDAIFALVDEP